MPSSETPHIVRSYEEDLKRLRDMIARMGGLAERQVADSASALIRRDTELAAEVVSRDAQLDALEREIEAFCVRLLALRQPMAGDLRLIVTSMKISSDLERIGDYARNGAKRAIVISSQPQFASLNGFSRLAHLVQENLKGAIDALVNAAGSTDESFYAFEIELVPLVPTRGLELPAALDDVRQRDGRDRALGREQR
jgi:phosphate transport system protein